MNYVSSKEISEIWKVSERRVQGYCVEGRIPGVKKMGRQWLIPSDAKKPSDRRTSSNTNVTDVPYHFPMLLYTSAFSSQDDLSDSEKSLLKAQILHLTGQFVESISLCNKILSTAKETHVLFGCHSTIALNAVPLGLMHMFNASLGAAESYAVKEKMHHEDFNLIIAHLHNQTNCNPIILKDIKTSLLSLDAQAYFFALCLHISLISATRESVYALHAYASYCRKITEEGIAPISILLNSYLSCILFQAGKVKEARFYTKIACDLVKQNNYWSFLTKFYPLNRTLINEYCKNSPDRIEFLTNTTSKFVAGWRNINRQIVGNVMFDGVSIEYAELLVMLVNDISIEEIARINGNSISDTKAQLEELCTILGKDNVESLAQYAKEQCQVK